ncbi:MAG: hypothetical protein KatS3mg114_1418 [Planctomycetaceae bacterium]|nr:MAG: hypothetical protein KatS3mg114_1418 [Planctomycetaceae bacterium]
MLGRTIFSTWLVCGGLLGCQQPGAIQWTASSAAQALPPEWQQTLQHELEKYVGTWVKPRAELLPDVRPRDLKHGQQVYQAHCAMCHGDSGDGQGIAAQYLYPKPRDYRKGIFKFVSTQYGARPLREDLLRIVRQGIRGTSMPEFRLLPERDLQAVVDYVILLARRGELEELLVNTVDAEGELDPQTVAEELVPTVIQRWRQAEEHVVYPHSPPPKFTSAHVARGRQAFLTKGCAKCHGEDGRGQTPENRGNDLWGHPARAADLTSGMLRGGQQSLDVYRRIHAGVNGTPMPGFALALQEEPDTIWDLVAYVAQVSQRRRSGEIPPPGLLKPYLTAESAPSAPAEE